MRREEGGRREDGGGEAAGWLGGWVMGRWVRLGVN